MSIWAKASSYLQNPLQRNEKESDKKVDEIIEVDEQKLGTSDKKLNHDNSMT